MSSQIDTHSALKSDLLQLFVRYGLAEDEAQKLLSHIWKEIAESLDFMEFVRSRLDAPHVGAEEIDPLAGMTEEEREALLQERLNAMDPEERDSLLGSIGKWADDEH